MIYGIGHDVLEIKRVALLLEGPHGQKFMDRVLTRAELVLAGNKGARRLEFVAGRFAAKEAVSKAFGCGIGGMIGFWDIEILPDNRGKPVVTLSQSAWSRLGINEPEQYVVHLTISHQTELASAFSVVEKL
ncbi:holo-ACP synthase [Paenibacillus dakarensis]|uniref:holo-ACP synthase n=1 Tax=Paenibacillus dakarensis TaxID=1527293 RepID=UPI0006D5A46E|nr:holo-ACP synthase [Paenibacillus dakarensis]